MQSYGLLVWADPEAPRYFHCTLHAKAEASETGVPGRTRAPHDPPAQMNAPDRVATPSSLRAATRTATAGQPSSVTQMLTTSTPAISRARPRAIMVRMGTRPVA